MAHPLRRVTFPASPFTALDGVEVSVTPDSRLNIRIKDWQELTTNDIAHISSPGRFEILGRADNVIITGGKKVHPETVEAVVESTLDAAVLVIDDSRGAPVPRDTLEIISVLKKVLPPESVPKAIVFGPIPRTPNGKKKRK